MGIRREIPSDWVRVRKWLSHAKYRDHHHETVEDELFNQISAFIIGRDLGEVGFTYWVRRYKPGSYVATCSKLGESDNKTTNDQTRHEDSLAVYYASALGLKGTARHMINIGFPTASNHLQEDLIITAAGLPGIEAVGCVKALMDSGGYIMTVDRDGNTIAHIAARNNNKEPPEYLAQTRDTSIFNLHNKAGMSSFHILCEREAGNVDLVKQLLQYREESLWEKSSMGLTGLQIAYQNYRSDRSLFLRQKEKEKMPELDLTGATPLHWSVFKGDLVETELLLREKADINARDNYHRTPFHMAFHSGNKFPPKEELMTLLFKA